jgi:hypothetical protein
VLHGHWKYLAAWFQAFTIFRMLCVIFWVVHQRMVLNSRCFGTLCPFHLHRRMDAKCVRVESCGVVK